MKQHVRRLLGELAGATSSGRFQAVVGSVVLSGRDMLAPLGWKRGFVDREWEAVAVAVSGKLREEWTGWVEAADVAGFMTVVGEILLHTRARQNPRLCAALADAVADRCPPSYFPQLPPHAKLLFLHGYHAATNTHHHHFPPSTLTAAIPLPLSLTDLYYIANLPSPHPPAALQESLKRMLSEDDICGHLPHAHIICHQILMILSLRDNVQLERCFVKYLVASPKRISVARYLADNHEMLLAKVLRGLSVAAVELFEEIFPARRKWSWAAYAGIIWNAHRLGCGEIIKPIMHEVERRARMVTTATDVTLPALCKMAQVIRMNDGDKTVLKWLAATAGSRKWSSTCSVHDAAVVLDTFHKGDLPAHAVKLYISSLPQQIPPTAIPRLIRGVFAHVDISMSTHCRPALECIAKSTLLSMKSNNKISVHTVGTLVGGLSRLRLYFPEFLKDAKKVMSEKQRNTSSNPPPTPQPPPKEEQQEEQYSLLDTISTWGGTEDITDYVTKQKEMVVLDDVTSSKERNMFQWKPLR